MIKIIFSKIPLFGGIVYCSKADFVEGFYRTLFNIAISTLPITFGALIIKFQSENPVGYIESLIKTSYNGELYLYTMAILAPLVYPALQNEFERNRIIIFLIIIGLLSSILLFTLYRANVLINNPEFVFGFSFFLFISSAVISYLAAVYTNRKGKGGLDITKKTTDDFTEALNKRHQ